MFSDIKYFDMRKVCEFKQKHILNLRRKSNKVFMYEYKFSKIYGMGCLYRKKKKKKKNLASPISLIFDIIIENFFNFYFRNLYFYTYIKATFCYDTISAVRIWLFRPDRIPALKRIWHLSEKITRSMPLRI